jgi:hypothetical protein
VALVFDHDPSKTSENNVSIVKVMSRLQTWTWPLNCRREAGGIWLQALEGFFAGR